MADLADHRPAHPRPERPRRGRPRRPHGPPRDRDRAAVRRLERAGRERRSSPRSSPRPTRPGPGDPVHAADALPRRRSPGRSSGASRRPAGPHRARPARPRATSSATSGARPSTSRAARSGPYGWIAAEIGRPKAVRAVGTALGHNPVPLIVPVPPRRPDGRHDRPVLARRTREQADDPRRRRASTPTRWSRWRARASATSARTRPTSCACRRATHAKRITDAHRVPFRSLAAGRRGRLPAVPGVPPGVGRGSLAA